MRHLSPTRRTASKMLTWPMMLVVSDSVGARHDVGTNDCAARWKIRSGRTVSSVSRVDAASPAQDPEDRAVAARQHVVDQMAAGEAGDAGDQNSHEGPLRKSAADGN